MFMNAFVKIDKVVPKLKWGKYKDHFLKEETRPIE
jgi:hypothetical protein